MSSSPSVLLIDDDLGTRETYAWVIGRAGLAVTAAASGAEGIRLARSLRPDLLVIDYRLPDMTGLDVVKALDRDGGRLPFVLISFWNDTSTTVEAMQLGAADVLDKSRDLDDLVATIRARAVVARLERPTIDVPPGPPLPWPRLMPPAEPHSAAERWAEYILRYSEADRDIKTVEGLATWLCISASRFNEACWLLGIPPHEARDLARMLRVVIKSTGRPLDVQALLEVSERRTLEKLLARAGISAATTSGIVSVEDFLRCQRFVPLDNAGLKALWALAVPGPPGQVG